VAQRPNSNSRRNFLRSGLIAISTATLAGDVTALPVNPPAEAPRPFLSASERRFPLAAVERLIPADEKRRGSADAGVVNYIDLWRDEVNQGD
jgi:hypothetical protein